MRSDTRVSYAVTSTATEETRISACNAASPGKCSPVPGDGDARESDEGEGRQDVVGESCIARVGRGLEASIHTLHDV